MRRVNIVTNISSEHGMFTPIFMRGGYNLYAADSAGLLTQYLQAITHRDVILLDLDNANDPGQLGEQIDLAFVKKLALSELIEPNKLHLVASDPKQLKSRIGAVVPEQQIHQISWVGPETQLLTIVSRIVATQ